MPHRSLVSSTTRLPPASSRARALIHRSCSFPSAGWSRPPHRLLGRDVRFGHAGFPAFGGQSYFRSQDERDGESDRSTEHGCKLLELVAVGILARKHESAIDAGKGK